MEARGWGKVCQGQGRAGHELKDFIEVQWMLLCGLVELKTQMLDPRGRSEDKEVRETLLLLFTFLRSAVYYEVSA